MVKVRSKVEALRADVAKFQEHIESPQVEGRINEIQEYFDMTRSEIKALTYERCVEAILELQLHAFHLQKRLNEQRAIIGYLESELQKGLGEHGAEFPGYHEKGEKLALVIRSNEYLSKVNEFLVQFRARSSSCYNEVNAINTICEAIKQIQFVKRPTRDQSNF